MRSQVRVALIALSTLLAAAPGHAVMCGDTINDAQTLTADISCGLDPVVTINEGGSLDMAGFKITCFGPIDGVALAGAGAKLSNGFITGCSHSGVLASAGGHKIENVVVSSSGTGFSIPSGDNKISNCTALNNVGQGFYMTTAGNSLSRIMAKGNAGGAIVAPSGGHKITDVSISNSGSAVGIALTGDGSKVSNVRISGGSEGLTVIGNSNKISEVTSLKPGTRGFRIVGDGNQLKKCVADAATSAQAGFAIGGGSENSISGCRSSGSTEGITVAGSGNIVAKNNVFGAADHGIESTGVNNVVTGNLAAGNGAFDLFENTAGCTTGDSWEKNVGTRNDACIE